MKMRYSTIFFYVIILTSINEDSIYSQIFKTSQLKEVNEPIERNTTRRISFNNIDLNVKIDRVRPYNYCKVISKYIKSKYYWNDVSLVWQKRFRRFGYWICYRDCGGGGDCLYKSIISGLNLNNTTVRELRNLVADAFVGFNSSKVNNMNENKTNTQSLINFDGELNINKKLNSTFSNWNETLFMEKMNILAVSELTGEWLDNWSPSRILNENSIDGIDISTNIKKALKVKKYLSTPGNTHWGTDLDVSYIEKICKVKIIIFWKNRGIFYSTLSSESKYRRYVLIYYDDLIGHFQVIGLKKFNSGNSEFISVFENRIPTSLKKLYLEDTKNEL